MDSVTYADSEPLDRAVSESGAVIHAGQIWKNKLSKFNSLFVVSSVYERSYVGGRTRTRVNGLQLLSGDPHSCGPSSLDVESLCTMYPFRHFEPYKPRPEEDK